MKYAARKGNQVKLKKLILCKFHFVLNFSKLFPCFILKSFKKAIHYFLFIFILSRLRTSEEN